MIPEKYILKPNDLSTDHLREIPGIGPTVVNRFKSRYGENALATISKIARDNPIEFTNISGVSSQKARNIYQQMIDSQVLVPPPYHDDVELTIEILSSIAEKRFGEILAIEVGSLGDRLTDIAKGFECDVNPESTPTLITPAIVEAFIQVEFIEIPEDERFDEETFIKHTYKIFQSFGLLESNFLTRIFEYDPIEIADNNHLPLMADGVEYVARELAIRAVYAQSHQLESLAKEELKNTF